MKKNNLIIFVISIALFCVSCSKNTSYTGKVTKVIGITKPGNGGEYSMELSDKPSILMGGLIPTSLELTVDGIDKPLILKQELAVALKVAAFQETSGYEIGVVTIYNKKVDVTYNKETMEITDIKAVE